MKLLNQSLLYLSAPIFLLISIWAIVFYFNMLDEIYDSIDDGLDNYKLLIIQKSKRDSTILKRRDFEEGNYAIREIAPSVALEIRDVYQDTLMHMRNEEEMETVRMLTTAFRRHQKYYELKVINSMVEENDQITNLLWSTFGLYILLLASITVVNHVALKRIWNPFYDLLEQFKSFRVDKDSTLPKMKTNTKEFLELKNATDTLIKHTQEVYQNQKQFIENASHELQTPLAIITNKLELLLEENKLANEEAETIAQVMQTTARLSKLNKSLLFLSKIENKQFFNNQPLSLNLLVQQVRRELEDFIAFKNINLKLDEKAQVEINMDAHLGFVLVSNLIKNAVFHNVDKGQVDLMIEQDTFIISNISPTGALAAQKIFKRFYKTTNKQKSTGLGLPIVQAICNLYNFEVSYHYTDRHFFTIEFR